LRGKVLLLLSITYGVFGARLGGAILFLLPFRVVAMSWGVIAVIIEHLSWGDS
jgi:hypothetical protein